MITNFLLMNGYGLYVWAAFLFTVLSFVSLYAIIKIQYLKERKKFIAKFGMLNPEKASFARSQKVIKDILSNTSSI